MRKILLIILGIFILAIIDYCLIDINFHKFWYPKYYNYITFKIDLKKYPKAVVQRVNYGEKLAKSKSIVICGLARNIESKLIRNIPKVEFIGQQFKKYKVVVFENDSDDQTRNLIKNWQQRNSNVTLLDCYDLGSCDCQLNNQNLYNFGAISNQRIDKMAFFRNRYLNYLKKHLNNEDYLLVLDFDVEGSISIDGIFHSISHQDWDMMCINGRSQIPGTLGLLTFAYDPLAYSSYHNNKSDNNNNKKNNNKINVTDLIRNVFEMNRLINQSPNNLIPVRSGFNGSAIYKLSSILNSSYKNVLRCEHIGFHQSMIDQGHDKLYLNPVWLGYFGHQGPRNIITINHFFSN